VTRVSPTASHFQNDDESRYFEVFSTKTAFELLPPFAAQTFHRIMLQAAQSDPSIRHAVIALGGKLLLIQDVSHVLANSI
jgi:hypothetical protein